MGLAQSRTHTHTHARKSTHAKETKRHTPTLRAQSSLSPSERIAIAHSSADIRPSPSWSNVWKQACSSPIWSCVICLGGTKYISTHISIFSLAKCENLRHLVCFAGTARLLFLKSNSKQHDRIAAAFAHRRTGVLLVGKWTFIGCADSCAGA